MKTYMAKNWYEYKTKETNYTINDLVREYKGQGVPVGVTSIEDIKIEQTEYIIKRGTI